VRSLAYLLDVYLTSPKRFAAQLLPTSQREEEVEKTEVEEEVSNEGEEEEDKREGGEKDERRRMDDWKQSVEGRRSTVRNSPPSHSSSKNKSRSCITNSSGSSSSGLSSSGGSSRSSGNVSAVGRNIKRTGSSSTYTNNRSQRISPNRY